MSRHAMKEDDAYRLALATLTNNGDTQSSTVDWYFFWSFFSNLTVFSKICKLPIANDPRKIENHLEGFHEITATAAVQILHDPDQLSSFCKEKGLTDIQGECGFCGKIFERSENGNFSFPRIKEHLTKCNPNYEHPKTGPKATDRIKWYRFF